MSLKIKVKTETEFPPIPEGTYTAICYTVADLGQQYNEKYKKTSNRILFIWEIVDDDLRIEIDGEMKRRAISKQYTASFGQKSNMYKDVRPWIGRDFTPEEMEGVFDVGSLAGTACLLNVSNDTNADGKVFSNVSAVMQLPKGVKVGKPENPVIVYDMDESPEDEMLNLPEWVQKIIKKSKEASIANANSQSVSVDPDTGEILGELEDMLDEI